MEIIFIILLIILNGIFALAEIAIVSARKSRLKQLAQEGSKNAQLAFETAQNPSRFLSTVQIGITLIGILAGAFAGQSITDPLSEQISTISLLKPFSHVISLAIVVSIITFFSLIFGELVPKRIALHNPEKIASIVVRPMNKLTAITSPLVALLTASSDLILKMLRIKQTTEEIPVSEEEIKMLIREGARVGVFKITEKDIVERTLALGDRRVNTFMTPRKEIIWIDIDSSFKTIRNKIAKRSYSYFPVCRDTLDKVLGIVRTEDLLADYLLEEKMDLKKFLTKPLFIPETMNGLEVLELFKKTGVHTALVVDEYGNIRGILTLTEILEAIVGDMPALQETEEKDFIKRDNNSWFVDGLVPTDDFKLYFHIKKLQGEKTGNFHTIGGFVMFKIGRIPISGDNFEWDKFRFEVVDMDGNRVDKLLVKQIK